MIPAMAMRSCRVVALPRARRLSSKPPADSRPSAETVRQLAESAKIQEKMWGIFVPERGIRFGDQRFWMLLGIVAALHAINTYRDAHKLPPDAKDLPDGAQRRLNDGRVLMADGSILKGDDIGVGGDGPTTLHKIKEKGEDELVLDRAWRKLKESV